MAEPNSEDSTIRYYCTAGNGMERFLIDEVKKKLSAVDVYQMPGKVLFNSSAGIDKVINLKTAERLFLLFKKDSPVQLPAHISPAKAASELQSKLLGDRNQWTCALMTWSRLRGELTNKERNLTNPALGVSREREEEKTSDKRRHEGEKCNVEYTTSTVEEREEENGMLRSGEHNGKQTQEKKKKKKKRDKEETGVEELRETLTHSPHREEKNGETSSELKTRKRKRNEHDDNKEEEVEWAVAQESCSRKNIKETTTYERQRVKEEVKEKGIALGFNSCVNDDDHAVISGIKLSGRHHETKYSVENKEKEKIYERRAETPQQSSNIKPEPSFAPVTFRINCKCTGSLSQYFSTQEVSKVIGVGLNRLMGWKTDLKNPELEIHVYLSDDYCLLGIPLTRLPLANRSYIKTTGLRSTVAWAMASLVQIQPGFCVVDTMCGVGTILIEAAQEHKAACFLGLDIDDGQLQRANENVAFSAMGNRIHLLKSSSMALPLSSASVDAIVCDLPFGKKFGTKTDMAANLPLILTEMERVLCVGGSLVLLLSPQLSCLLKKFLAQKETVPMPNQPATRIQDSPSSSQSSTKQQTFQINQGVKSPSIQETDPQFGLPLSSLRHQATFRVSLGAIDGLIIKYVKMET